MSKSISSYHKFFNFFVILSLLFQTFAPAVAIIPQAYAQEVTPETTVTETPTDVTPTVAAEEPSPTAEVTPEPTNTPEQVVTETPTTTTENDNTSSQGPPSPTVTTENQTSDSDAHLSATILQDVSAPTLDLSSPTDTTSATISTDKADYAPTDTAVITGKGFEGNKDYTLEVVSTDEPAVDFLTTVTTNEDGGFIYAYQLDGNYRPDYTVYVKNGDEVVATTTFTDAVSPTIDVYSQCGNGNGTGPTCNWTNGNLNGSNSTYQEGDSTVQRLAIKDLVTGDYTVTIQYDTLKSGKHAYDFITDDKFSENWVTNSDFCSSPVGNIPSCSSLTPNLSGVIPAAANAGGFDTAAGSARHFTIRNGTWVGTGIFSGPTQVAGADAPTNIQLKFHVDTTTCNKYNAGNQQNPVDACEVLITFGAHVSRQANWGAGNSAVNISGSPYHVRTVELNGSNIGNRDNQMAASAIPSIITIHKVTVPGGSQQSFAFTTTGNGYNGFSLTDGQQNSQQVANGSNNNLALYSVTETAVPGYAVSISCTASGDQTTATPNNGTRSVAIAVGPNGGNVVDCTFTNTLQQGTVELKKVWVGTGGQTTLNIGTSVGGTQTDSQLTGTNGGGPLTTGQNTVNQGTYFMSETGGLSNYTTAALACFNDADNNGINNGESAVTVGANDSVALLASQHVICTYTNTRKQGTVELKKVWSGTAGQTTLNIGTSNGGSQVDTQQTGANGAAPLTTGANTVDTGTYYVSETGGLNNYGSSLSCTKNGQPEIPGANDSLVVGKDDVVVCTFTNTRNTGTLQVLKNVDLNGDGDFDDQGELGAADWKWQANGGSDHNTGDSVITVDTGDYDLTETAKTNFHFEDLTCEGGDLDGNTVTVVKDAEVVCTFSNARDKGKLKVLKNVDLNGDGDYDDADETGVTNWAWDIESGEQDIATGQERTLITGTYTVSEDPQTNYHLVDWSCSDQTSGTTNSISASVTKDATLTCTFNNARDTGTLQVLKNVDLNGDGDYTDPNETGATDWKWQADGGSDHNTGDSAMTVITGDYVLSETAKNNFHFVSLSCENGDLDTSTNTVTVVKDADVVCTFTNARDMGSIELKKHWVGPAGDTTLKIGTTADGDEVDSEEVSGSDDTTSVNSVPTGTYHVSETTLPNYDTRLACEDEEGEVTVGQDNAVDVAKDQAVVCTFTNTKHATLKLEKTVKNDNGGEATEDDFQGKIDDGDVDWDEAKVVAATSHTASETNIAGYSASDWGGDCAADGTVSLNPGDNKVCTITNDDIAPKLHLRKVVVNNNGGNALNTDWTLNANGTDDNDLSGTTPVDSSGTLQADTFALSEIGGPTGYDASDWVCTGDGQLTDSNITLGLDEEATCTITNDDIPAHLIVIKHVINDDLGVASASDFTMNINDVTATGGNSFPGAESPGTNKTLTSVGNYNVTESGPGGYDASFSDDCTGTIALGETKTCTITNNDQQGRMTGGGSVFTKNSDGDTILGLASNNVRITHGFEIHCRIPGKKDNIEINWNDKTGKAHKFHLDVLTSAVCTKAGNPAPPKDTANGFNTFTGVGTGSYDGVAGATLNFVFTDFGEPGRKDTAQYLVKVGSNVVLDVDPKFLDQGNHQAHRF